MSYSEEYLGGCVLPTSAPSTAQSLASTGDILVYNLGEQIELNRIMFEVSVAVVSSAPAVISVYSRPTFGSASGQILIGTLSIPGGTAAGSILYKPVESLKLTQGTQLAFNVSTAATSSGSGFSMFKAFLTSEDPKNVSAMILSA